MAGFQNDWLICKEYLCFVYLSWLELSNKLIKLSFIENNYIIFYRRYLSSRICSYLAHLPAPSLKNKKKFPWKKVLIFFRKIFFLIFRNKCRSKRKINTFSYGTIFIWRPWKLSNIQDPHPPPCTTTSKILPPPWPWTSDFIKHNPRMTIICHKSFPQVGFCFQYQLINLVWLNFDFFFDLAEGNLVPELF